MAFYFDRTNVECGGQCLSYSGCEGFHFADNVCKLLMTKYLYKDPTTQIDVYVAMSAVKGNEKIIKQNGFH